MSKPFNFYQQISGNIYPEFHETPFGLFYSNVSGLFGVYFSYSVANGAPFYLSSEGDTRPTKIRIGFSGAVDKELKDIYRYSITPSGAMYPAQPDAASYSVYPQGAETGIFPDKGYISIPWNGVFTGCPVDKNIIGISQVGNVDACSVDTSIHKVTWSADVIDGENNIYNYSMVFVGNLRPKYRDVGSESFILNDMTFTPGLDIVTTNISDLANNSFIINTITFTQAV
jgi:hypothetical protein